MAAQIKLVRELIACNKVNEAYVLFMGIDCDFSLIVDKEEKWPHQTDKQVLGAQLFFPQELRDMNDLLLHIYGRMDVLNKLSYAATFRDPVSYYYLCEALKTHSLQNEHKESKFIQNCINKLKDKVNKYLEIDNPHIFPYAYLKYLVENDTSYLKAMAIAVFDVSGTDPRAMYYCANITKLPEEKRKEYYEKAYARGYKRALLQLTRWSGTSEECFQIYQRAAEEGVVKAYWYMGNMILNKGYRRESVKKGIDYLEKAAIEGKMLSAFHTLADYYLRKGDMAKYKEYKQREYENSISLIIASFCENQNKEMVEFYVSYFHKICDIHSSD
jgi:TPR repeat protein